MRGHLIFVCAALLSGCTTQLSTIPASTNTKPDLAFAPPTTPVYGYYLPRETYQITVVYQLVACPAGTLNPTNPPVVHQQVTITPVDNADLSEHYFIDYPAMDSSWKNTTFAATLYPNQTLKAIGVSISSQVAQSATNFISAGLNAAKMAAALAPASGPMTCSANASNAFKIQSDLMGYSSKAATLASNDRSGATDVLSRLTPMLTITVTGRFDPAKLDDMLVIKPSVDQLAVWFDGLYDPGLDPFLETTVVIGPKRTLAPLVRPTANPIGGVVYRDPVPAFIKACAGEACTNATPNDSDGKDSVQATSFVNIPQLGPYMVLPLRNTALDNNNLSVTFAANGTACSIAYGKQSRMYQLSTILNNPSVSSSGGGSGSSSGSSSSSSKSSGGGSGGSGSGSGSSTGGASATLLSC